MGDGKKLISVPQHFILLFKRILISDLTLHLDWQMN